MKSQEGRMESGLKDALKEEKGQEGEFEGGVEGEKRRVSYKEKECQEKKRENSGLLSRL